MPKEITYELSDKTLAKLKDIAGGGGSLTDICYVLDADSATLGEDIAAYFESIQTDPRPVVVKRSYDRTDLYYESTPYELEPTERIADQGVIFNCKDFHIFFNGADNCEVRDGNYNVIQKHISSKSDNTFLTLETRSDMDGQTLYVSTENEVSTKIKNYLVKTETGFNANIGAIASLTSYQEIINHASESTETINDTVFEVHPEGVRISLSSEDNTQEEPITKGANYEFTTEGLSFNKKLIGNDTLIVKIGENYNVQSEGDLPEDLITNDDIFNALQEGKNVRIISRYVRTGFGYSHVVTNYVDTVWRDIEAGEDENVTTYHFTLVIPYKEDDIGIEWDDNNQVFSYYNNSPK